MINRLKSFTDFINIHPEFNAKTFIGQTFIGSMYALLPNFAAKYASIDPSCTLYTLPATLLTYGIDLAVAKTKIHKNIKVSLPPLASFAALYGTSKLFKLSLGIKELIFIQTVSLLANLTLKAGIDLSTKISRREAKILANASSLDFNALQSHPSLASPNEQKNKQETEASERLSPNNQQVPSDQQVHSPQQVPAQQVNSSQVFDTSQLLLPDEFDTVAEGAPYPYGYSSLSSSENANPRGTKRFIFPE